MRCSGDDPTLGPKREVRDAPHHKHDRHFDFPAAGHQRGAKRQQLRQSGNCGGQYDRDDRPVNARTADEASTARTAAEAQRATLNKLRELKADGRVVLNFHPNDAGVDDIPAIPLEDGDELYVPGRPIIVSVFGDVYNQGSFLQRPGKTVNAVAPALKS